MTYSHMTHMSYMSNDNYNDLHISEQVNISETAINSCFAKSTSSKSLIIHKEISEILPKVSKIYNDNNEKKSAERELIPSLLPTT